MFKKKFLSIKNIFISIFAFIFFSLIIIIYNNDRIIFLGFNKLDELTDYQLNISKKRSSFVKFIEQLDFINLNQSYFNLPTLEIEIDRNNVSFFKDIINKANNNDEIYYKQKYLLPSYGNQYSDQNKARLYFNKEKYNIEIKFHGRSDEHYLNKKKSYAIKFSNKKLFNNMREIALIILDEQDIRTIWSNKILEDITNFKVNTEIIRLKINGIDQGLYLLEEKLRKELLEKNNLSGVDIYSPLAMWTNQTDRTHTHLFNYEISSINEKKFSGLENGQIEKYIKIFNKNNYYELEKILNIENFAKFEAIRLLHADGHVASGDNLKLLYDNAEGRFSPFYRSESVIGSIDRYASETSYTYDSIAKDIRPFNIITKNNDFRNLRNYYLNQILNKSENYINYYEELINFYKQIISNDFTNLLSRREYIFNAETNFKVIKNNIERLKNYLYYGKTYSTLIQRNKRLFELEINSDSNSYTSITNINILNKNLSNLFVNIQDLQSGKEIDLPYSDLNNYFKTKKYILSIDDNYDLIKNSSKYILTFNKDINENLIDFKINFKNTVTNRDIDKIYNYYKFIKITDKKANHVSKKNYSDKIKYNNLNDEFIFLKGDHFIKENLIFPYGSKVSIQKGAKLFIYKNKSVFINGSFNAIGDEKNPILITSIDNDPFGSFMIIGNGKTEVNIQYANISGGSETQLNNIYASGQFSIHKHDHVFIHNNIFYSSNADDGLNIKNTKYTNISNNLFKNNFADHIDLDNTNGKIVNNEFINEISNSEGDGLDLSGSNVLVSKNKFYNFEDKGVSVGEKSGVILQNNFFTSNRSAITAKDQSLVILDSKNVFIDNELDIEMYIKKSFFKAAKVCNLNSDQNLNISKINFANLKMSEKDINEKNIYIQTSNKNKINNFNINIFNSKSNFKKIIKDYADSNCSF